MYPDANLTPYGKSMRSTRSFVKVPTKDCPSHLLDFEPKNPIRYRTDHNTKSTIDTSTQAVRRRLRSNLPCWLSERRYDSSASVYPDDIFANEVPSPANDTVSLFDRKSPKMTIISTSPSRRKARQQSFHLDAEVSGCCSQLGPPNFPNASRTT